MWNRLPRSVVMLYIKQHWDTSCNTVNNRDSCRLPGWNQKQEHIKILYIHRAYKHRRRAEKKYQAGAWETWGCGLDRHRQANELERNESHGPHASSWLFTTGFRKLPMLPLEPPTLITKKGCQLGFLRSGHQLSHWSTHQDRASSMKCFHGNVISNLL